MKCYFLKFELMDLFSLIIVYLLVREGLRGAQRTPKKQLKTTDSR